MYRFSRPRSAPRTPTPDYHGGTREWGQYNLEKPARIAAAVVYFWDEEGTAVVLKAGKDMVRLAENRLEGPLLATPAFADAAIYLRTDRFLFCIREEPSKDQAGRKP